MQQQSDAELLREYAVNGSEHAFGEIVSRHADLVYAAAWRQCGSREMARDAGQHVFTDLARKAPGLLHRLASQASLAGWLYRSTRFAVLNLMRTERRRSTHERMLMAQTGTTPSTDDSADWKSVAHLIDEAMVELREKDREAVLLRYFKNHDFHTVGRALGISDDAAQKRVSRAVERLRELLAQRGATIGGTALLAAITAHATMPPPAGWATAVAGTALHSAASESTVALGAWAKTVLWAKTHTAVVSGAGLLLLASAVGVYMTQRAGRPGKRLPLGPGIAALNMGGSHGVVLSSDGSLWSWGTNFLGWSVLGLGNVAVQPKLERIGADNDWVSVSSSPTHCLALKADGTIWGWGANIYGQLGNSGRKRANDNLSEPVSVLGSDGWRQVAAGGSHSLALNRDGTLWGWGNNWAGQVGVGSASREIAEPTQVGRTTNWTRVWASGLHSVAAQSDGSLWFWGSLTGSADDTNQIRVPTRVSADTNWSEVGFGYFVVLAIKTDGTLWIWGRNAGIYTGEPIQLANPVPARAGTDSDWKAVSTSEGFYHLLQKRDGSLWAMDARGYANVNKSSSPMVKLTRIPLAKNVVAFDAARSTGAALTKDGELWTWGEAFTESRGGSRWLHSLVQAIGWKTDRFAGKPVVREEPWRLALE